jgi:hypothetical protein
MNQIFQCFRIIRVSIGPLHYLSSRSDFGFKFAEIFIIKIWLPDSVSQGIAGSLYWWVGESPSPHISESQTPCISESPTPCISESGSHQLPASVNRGVANSPYWWVGESAIKLLKENSPYWWIGESATPQLSDSGSCCLNTFLKTLWLKESGSRGVADSTCRWVGESESRWLQRVGNSPNCSVAEWFFDFEYLHKFEAKVRTAKTVVYGNHIKPIYAKNLGKFGSLPCPFSL